MRRYITISEFQHLHPAQLQCDTDRFYAQLANTIGTFIEDAQIGFYRDEIKQTCAAIALWLEDIASNTHQWEVFEKLYKQQYQRELPFYTDVDDDNWLFYQLQFIVWHSLQSTSSTRIFNPENLGLIQLTQDLFNYFMQQGYYDEGTLPANQELADYLFCEETQTDFFEVKKVLMWLAFDSYFGHWDSTFLGINSPQVMQLCSFHEGLTPHPALYQLRSNSSLADRCWPLSIYAKDIYAEMIRLEMDDDDDPYAQAIADIEAIRYGLNRIVSANDTEITLEDYTGYIFTIQRQSYNSTSNTDGKHYMFGSFAKFNNQWEANGIGSWLENGTPVDWEKYCQEQTFREDKESNKILLERLGGKQLHFVKDTAELIQWQKDHIGIGPDIDEKPYIERLGDAPLVIFVPEHGGISVYNIAEFICAPDNPYYDKEYAQEDAIDAVVNAECCSPEMLQYLLDHNMLPDAGIASLRGEEYGRQQVQDNLYFLARCMRRDL